MRPPRPLGPPSTVSSSSGHNLVYGIHRPRSQPVAFTPESVESQPTKRKTRLIVILGIALPVLACVIGIAAWAVTTDVLRITPRANDNNYNRFGHQGKTRIQSRSDHDVDVFVLHGITAPTPPSSRNTTKKPSLSPTKSTTRSSKMSSSSSTMSSTESSVSSVQNVQTVASVKASELLSKLLSDMPTPKNPKNFIVFAPVPDMEDTGKERKGRRFDSKVVLRDGDDLVAEESVLSEETSQELGFEKIPLNKRRKPTAANHSTKLGTRYLENKKKQKEKQDRNPRLFSTDNIAESQNFVKRPHHGDFATSASNLQSSVNTISNRNGGVTANLHRNNFPNPQQNTVNGFQKNTATDQQPFRNPTQISDKGQSMALGQNYQSPTFPQPVSPSINQENTPQFQGMGPNNFQNKEISRLHPFQNQQNIGPPPNQQNIGPPQNQQNSGPPQNQFPPLHVPPPNQQNMGPPPNQQNMGPPPNQQNMGPPPNQQNMGPPPNQYPPGAGPPPPNFSNPPQSTFTHDSSPMGSGGPQYFAPPPHTFHTKINHDQPSSKYISSPSAMSSYEKVAQSSVDHSAADGTHVHHHHHHHHEPVASNSDPVGDVNYSDVPRATDADRLGSIGIGLGPSRGITLQIGGGGGGLGGLLPLGTLGIARNIVSALLPRPQLGLNSKVFLGFEVGRGGGLSIG